MRLTSLTASILSIPFKTVFKHASAERAVTETLWVQADAESGAIGFGEGCPRNYVSAETLSSSQEFIATYLNEWLAGISDLESLIDWSEHHRAEIDANPAAWTAVELALLDLLGKETQQPVEALLGLPKLAGAFRYTAVLGDAAPQQFEAQLNHYLKAGFSLFKIKLSGNEARDHAKIHTLIAAGIAPEVVRADANNLWNDAPTAIDYLTKLDFAFFAIEEPLQAGDIDGMKLVAKALNTRIILDESLLRVNQLQHFSGSAQTWIINLRISKMGGLLRSLQLAREAQKVGIPIIIGAHVGETSVLTRAALTVANSARDNLLAQEGAFSTHLLTADVVESPLIFGLKGVLDSDAYGIAEKSGFGLNIQHNG